MYSNVPVGLVPVLVSALHDRGGQTQLLPEGPGLRGRRGHHLVFCSS